MSRTDNFSRGKKTKLSITTSLSAQIVTLLCGFIIPRLMISSFGSEAYGAVASISQFLGYITLLEGGVSGVVRAALYKPLSMNDEKQISAVVYETERFFKTIAKIFVVYVLVLAFSFKNISHINYFDYYSTIFLVISISIATIAQYLFGITSYVFLLAAQKAYITNITTIITIIVNTAMTIVLIKVGCNLITVKLVSSVIFVAKPIVFNTYVKRHYNIVKVEKRTNALAQKWDALGQHIAYFLYSNTDIIVLTIFVNLRLVAVYSVYNMIIGQMQNVINSFSNGMEALFGDMLAKQEYDSLKKKFGYFETLISLIATVVFSTTAVLVVAFVNVYTRGLNDVNYSRPVFSFILDMAAYIFCLRLPYHTIIIASGKFKETNIGGYGEAIINIILSIVLVQHYGLIGVAIGTVVASTFRFVYYAIFLSKNILKWELKYFVKREVMNAFPFFLVYVLCTIFITKVDIINYLQWVIVAIIVLLISCVITIGFNYIAYPAEVKSIFSGIHVKVKKKQRWVVGN